MYADGMFVLALHVVDVMSNARHGRQGDDDVRIAGRLRSVAMFDDVLQQQVVLEDSLHRFQQVRAERQRVLQLRLAFTARPAGRLISHQVCQHRHFPIIRTITTHKRWISYSTAEEDGEEEKEVVVVWVKLVAFSFSFLFV